MLADAFLVQARACKSLGSPYMDQLLNVLAQSWPIDTPFGRLCAEWPGDLSPHGASLPLRIAGGLHALVLSGQDSALSAVYPPNQCDDGALKDAVLAALDAYQDFLTTWVQNAPQTNEVRRSAALIASAHWLAARYPMPIVTSELGASAGLNLNWDRYGLEIGQQTFGPSDPVLTLSPQWTGPMVAPASVAVVERRGVDLNPLDVTDPDQVLRLLAYLWPDQPYRVDLTRAAISAHRGRVEQGDAIDWLETRLQTPRPGHLHLIYHTIAWQYFPSRSQARGTALIEEAGTRATSDAPLAWLRMESDGGKDGAALTLRLWPGDQLFTLGRVDFHGRWVKWEAP
jgi:hypothetical protein